MNHKRRITSKSVIVLTCIVPKAQRQLCLSLSSREKFGTLQWLKRVGLHSIPLFLENKDNPYIKADDPRLASGNFLLDIFLV